MNEELDRSRRSLLWTMPAVGLAFGTPVTEQILNLSATHLNSNGDKQRLAAALRQFVRMYAPNEAREDTSFVSVVAPDYFAQ
jgi:hypothetical protein